MAGINYTGFLGITAFTSTAEIDFFKGEPASEAYVLTPAQRAYLNARGIAADGGIIVPKQVHGDAIWKVTRRDIPLAGIHEADAVVTDEPGLVIGIRTADCLPALVYAPRRKVIAAIHAGWKSTRLDIARKTDELLARDYGVDPGELRVAIGPCIRRDSCEVGPEFKEYFPLDTVATPQGLRFDIFSANFRQLTSAGVERGNIFDCGLCSVKEPARFHSFRRDVDRSGRMISLLVMP